MAEGFNSQCHSDYDGSYWGTQRLKSPPFPFPTTKTKKNPEKGKKKRGRKERDSIGWVPHNSHRIGIYNWGIKALQPW